MAARTGGPCRAAGPHLLVRPLVRPRHHTGLLWFGFRNPVRHHSPEGGRLPGRSETLDTLRSTSLSKPIMLSVLLTVIASAPPASMPRVEVAADKKGFVLAGTTTPFRPWGLNYGNAGRLIEDFWAD